MRVLIIDDEQMSVDGIKGWFEHKRKDWFVDSAATYTEAQDKSMHVIWDVVIADVKLRGGDDNEDGARFASMYKSINPLTTVRLITGTKKKKILGFDSNEIYQKPFRIEELLKDIEGGIMSEMSEHTKKIDLLSETVQGFALEFKADRELNKKTAKKTDLIFEFLNGDLKNTGLISMVKTHAAWFKWIGGLGTLIIGYILKLEFFG